MQFLNLGLVPTALQPLVVSCVNVGWKTTLSLLNHHHHPSPSPHSAAELTSQVVDLWCENEELRASLNEMAKQNQQLQARVDAMGGGRGRGGG